MQEGQAAWARRADVHQARIVLPQHLTLVERADDDLVVEQDVQVVLRREDQRVLWGGILRHLLLLERSGDQCVACVAGGDGEDRAGRQIRGRDDDSHRTTGRGHDGADDEDHDRAGGEREQDTEQHQRAPARGTRARGANGCAHVQQPPYSTDGCLNRTLRCACTRAKTDLTPTCLTLPASTTSTSSAAIVRAGWLCARPLAL